MVHRKSQIINNTFVFFLTAAAKHLEQKVSHKKIKTNIQSVLINLASSQALTSLQRLGELLLRKQNNYRRMIISFPPTDNKLPLHLFLTDVFFFLILLFSPRIVSTWGKCNCTILLAMIQADWLHE